MTDTLIVVQARLESVRLPQKVILPLCGQPMLLWLLDRLSIVDATLVVAIPDTPANASLAQLCATHGYAAHLIPGDPSDVLGRFAKVALLYPEASCIVRVCGDTPLLDPEVITRLLDSHAQSLWRDYTGLAREWGDGMDCEAFSREALLLADSEATQSHEREHVSPFLWSQPQRFQVAHLPCPFDLSWLRCSADDKTDLLHVQMLLDLCLSRHGIAFTWRDVWQEAQRNETLRMYMQKRPMNGAYLAQVGSAETWEKLRYSQEGS